MSFPELRVRPGARRDLRDMAEWLRRQADPDTAERVVAETRATFQKLADTPGLGAPAEAKANELANARRWLVRRYPNYLIFYEPAPYGVDILRVLHGALDWKRR